MSEIEWVAINKFNKLIGAVGFIGNDAVAVVAFYDDRDGNQDGEVSWGEWLADKFISMDGRATTEVAMQARVEMDIIMRDASFGQVAASMFLDFAGSLIRQGVYIAYFSRGVKLTGSAVAKTMTDSMIKQFAIRKGFEAAVKKAFEAATS